MRTRAYECPECRAHNLAEDSWTACSCPECGVRVLLGWYDSRGNGWRIVKGTDPEHPRQRTPAPTYRKRKRRAKSA